MKRDLVALLTEKLLKSYNKKANEFVDFNYPKIQKIGSQYFSALVRNKEQEKACKEMGINKIYYENYDIVKQANINSTKVNYDNNLIVI